MSNPYDSPTFGNALSLRVDGAIGAMSLAPNGRNAVLAGRKGLYIIDMDDPFTPPRWLRHITSWEVADVQWSPHAGAKPSWCVSTSNQKALLWDLSRPANGAIQSVLHRHTRAITDVNFHPQHPEILATCSIDTFVFTWDMRSPRRPVYKYAEWRAGATQVKWRSGHEHQLVSSHHHSFYLWDARKGALPVARVENAHSGKINGLDFSGLEGRLITCSNDATVKFWDAAGLSEPLPKPAVVLQTAYPVARARRLPFGNDPCCGIMPVHGGDNAIHVVNLAAAFRRACSLGGPIYADAVADYSFRGHTGPVKDFLWRTQHERYEGFDGKRSWKEHQLVTWSPRDCDFKLWPHERAIYDAANYNPQHQALLASMVSGAVVVEDSSSVSGSGTPEAELDEETVMFSGVAPNYASYISEPETNFADFSKDSGGDLLSRLAAHAIKKTHVSLGRTSQLNHLNWISGVRMGRQGNTKVGVVSDIEELSDRTTPSQTDGEGPTNLGEEISIVGHKFSKLRFEKISVSTGEIEISLRGPLPVVSHTLTAETIPSSESIRPEHEKRDSISETSNAVTQSIAGVNPTNAGSSTSGQKTTSSSVSVPNATSNGITNTQNMPPSIPSRQNISVLTITPSIKQIETLPIMTTDAAPEQKLIFIRLEIKFPKSYPFLEPMSSKTSSKKQPKNKRQSQIRFDVEETHELNSQVKQDMIHNLEAIAQFYSNKYNKYCLEPCLRYLMGEKIDLNDGLMTSEIGQDAIGGSDNEVEIGDENWVDDLIDQHEAAAAFTKDISLSVDDDDDDDDDADLIYANNYNLSSRREQARRTEYLKEGKSDSTRDESKVSHDSTPLPKGCGAIWTNTGELVCFFIPKTSDVSSSNKCELECSESADLEMRANQLYRPSNPCISASPKNTNGEELANTDSEISESSDSDSDSIASNCSSSSDESLLDDWDGMLQDEVSSRSRRPDMFRATITLGRHVRMGGPNKDVSGLLISGKSSAYKSSAIDDSVSKTTKKSRKGKRAQSVISIIDFRHLIPDKFELACEYRVLGESPDVIARHNSEVAYFHGYPELGQVWRLIQMILEKRVDLSDLSEVAKNFLTTHGGAASLDFYWGNHPLGHSWLINELFAYFERKRDLQMLAMLSCLLFENLRNVRKTEARALEIPIHTPYPSLPPRLSNNSIREQKILLSEEAIEVSRCAKDAEPQKEFRKPSVISQREVQSSRPISGEATVPCESTSLSSMRLASSALRRSETSSVVENMYPGQLSDRNARSFDTSKASVRIPVPGRNANRGISPKGKSLVVQREKTRPPPVFTIEIKNTESLDLHENIFVAPLLGEIDQEKLSNYREQYAEMLYTWGLPMHRIKILKFNYHCNVAEATKNAQYNAHEVAFKSRNKKALHNKQSLICAITPISTASDNAWNTKSRNSIHYCGYCGLIVSKRVVICTKCEHIVHSHCAAEWWTPEVADEVMAECPTGCGCMCLLNGKE